MMQITSAINSFGPDVVAGNSAAVSVFSIASAFYVGFGLATTVFMGQNIGAKKPDRVRGSFRACLLLSVLITGSLGMILYLISDLLIGFIVGFGAEVSISYGVFRLSYLARLIFIVAANNILSHALQAFGYPILTTITNIFFHLGFRVIWMQFVYPLYPQYVTVIQCFVLSWIMNFIFYAIFFSIVYVRYVKYGKCRRV